MKRSTPCREQPRAGQAAAPLSFAISKCLNMHYVCYTRVQQHLGITHRASSSFQLQLQLSGFSSLSVGLAVRVDASVVFVVKLTQFQFSFPASLQSPTTPLTHSLSLSLSLCMFTFKNSTLSGYSAARRISQQILCQTSLECFAVGIHEISLSDF